MTGRPAAAPIVHESIEALLSLSNSTRVYVGHDHREGGRDAQREATIGEQRLTSIPIATRSSSRCAMPATPACRCRH